VNLLVREIHNKINKNVLSLWKFTWMEPGLKNPSNGKVGTGEMSVIFLFQSPGHPEGSVALFMGNLGSYLFWENLVGKLLWGGSLGGKLFWGKFR